MKLRNIFVFIVVLFIGIGSTFYLNQFKQIINLQVYAQQIGKSAWEQKSNPFGDGWALKNVSNKAIPISAGISHFVVQKPGDPNTPEPAEINYIANSNGKYIYDDGAKLLEPNKDLQMGQSTYSSARVKDYISKIHQVNPSIKYIGYLTPALLGDYYNGYYELMANHQDWLVYDQNRPIRLLYGTAEGEYLGDITNPGYRAFLAQKSVESMRFHGFSGVLLDGVLPNVGAFSALSGDPPAAFKQNWNNGWVEFIKELKQRAPELEIFLSPYDMDENFMRQFLVAGADGYFFENPFGPSTAEFDFIAGQGRVGLPFTQRMIDFNRNLGKKVLLSNTVTGPGNNNPPSINRTEDINRYRYYLAIYMMFFYNPNSPVHYLYYPFNLGGADYYLESDIRLGSPIGNANPQYFDDVYRRDFEKGSVYLNLTNQVFEADLRRPMYDAYGTRYETKVPINPKSGIIVADQDALPFAVTVSPSPAIKQGDIDNDGDVDIFDFNSLVSDFGKKNNSVTKADLDGDDDVDVFDFNILVGRFGK